LIHEGPFAFSRGWLPSYLRIAPHFIVLRLDRVHQCRGGALATLTPVAQAAWRYVHAQSLPLLEQIRHLFGLSTL